MSFISLRLVLPVVAGLLTGDGRVANLIKPQFEAGKGKVGKKFVDKDGDHVVEVNIWGENQDGVLHTKSDFVVKLASRAEYDRPL